jgi:tetratricopeptide (TPR) repeat protein
MTGQSRIYTSLSVLTIALAAVSLVLVILIYSSLPKSPEDEIVNNAKKLAGELTDNNLPEAAIEEYGRIIEKAYLDNTERGAVNYLIGKIYFEDIGDYEKAAAFYIRARSLDENASYYNEAGKNLITCLERMGRRLDARRELDRQISFEPDTGKVTGKIAAKVGSYDITLSDFNKAIQSLPSEIQDEFSGTEGRKQFLSRMIGRELLYHAALREGFDKESKVRRDMKNIEKEYLVQYYTQEKVIPTIEPDTAELNLYYQANKDKFDGKEFEEVREQVTQEYMAYISRKAVNEYIEKLMEAEPVQTFEENLE